MKTELRFAPVFGWYAKQIGCIPVDRSAGRPAMDSMLQAIEQRRTDLGQLVIYPQGTRVAPGARRQYRFGAAAAYEQTGLPCVLAATNAGLFWGRNRFRRLPGTAVLEFLGPLPQGLSAADALAEMERKIEPASDRLMAAAFGVIRNTTRLHRFLPPARILVRTTHLTGPPATNSAPPGRNLPGSVLPARRGRAAFSHIHPPPANAPQPLHPKRGHGSRRPCFPVAVRPKPASLPWRETSPVAVRRTSSGSLPSSDWTSSAIASPTTRSASSGLRCAPPRGSFTIRSITPSRSRSLAVS